MKYTNAFMRDSENNQVAPYYKMFFKVILVFQCLSHGCSVHF